MSEGDGEEHRFTQIRTQIHTDRLNTERGRKEMVAVNTISPQKVLVNSTMNIQKVLANNTIFYYPLTLYCLVLY